MAQDTYHWSRSVADIQTLLGGDLLSGDGSTKISSVCVSSVDCSPGAIFVAIQGNAADGHRYIPDAVERGASLIVAQRGSDVLDVQQLRSVPLMMVPDTRVALSRLAAECVGHPSAALQVVGVTGTNGKTTINWLVFHLLTRLGSACARLGTLGLSMPGVQEKLGMRTTPDAVQLHRALRRAIFVGCKSAVLEVSSHALVQHRADDVRFDVAAFSNLTHDHLDYHKSMDEYFAAKRTLFELAASSGKRQPTAVICVDDPYGVRLAAQLRGDARLRICTVGFDLAADLCIREFHAHPSGSSLVLSMNGQEVCARTEMLGHHNARNAAIAVGSVCALGYELQQVCDQLPGIPVISGRLEVLRQQSPAVYVDYAHTPDALEKALSAVRLVTKGNVWVLFGCGGDRDPGKRPIMAEVATSYADRVVLTSDNPRTEDPQKIIDEVLDCPAGEVIKANGVVQVDRTQAIRAVLRAAGPADSVMIAGKGHEDYQIIGTERFHFSDQEEVRRFFSEQSEEHAHVD